MLKRGFFPIKTPSCCKLLTFYAKKWKLYLGGNVFFNFFIYILFFSPEYFRLDRLSFTTVQTTSEASFFFTLFLNPMLFLNSLLFSILPLGFYYTCNKTERIRCPCADKSNMISRSSISGKLKTFTVSQPQCSLTYLIYSPSPRLSE